MSESTYENKNTIHHGCQTIQSTEVTWCGQRNQQQEGGHKGADRLGHPPLGHPLSPLPQLYLPSCKPVMPWVGDNCHCMLHTRDSCHYCYFCVSQATSGPQGAMWSRSSQGHKASPTPLQYTNLTSFQPTTYKVPASIIRFKLIPKQSCATSSQQASP